jgi:hypothetical protein
VIDAEAIEEPAEGDAAAAEARPLPERRRGAELDTWRGEVKAIAVVAAGGIAAGAATVAALSVAKRSGVRPRGLRRTSRGRENILASRSFLVDVHVLSR